MALSMISAPLLYAVGNIIIEDLATLYDQGLVFNTVENLSNSEVVTIRYRIPGQFHFSGAMGTKPFQRVSFYQPTNRAARERGLIAATGTKFHLLVEKRNEEFHGQFSLIKKNAENTYLEFLFNQGPGYPPMLIHVPLKLLIDLRNSTKQNNTK